MNDTDGGQRIIFDAYEGLSQGYLKKMGQHLAEKVGVPVRISATVIRAKLAETSAGLKEKKEKEDKKGEKGAER